MTLAACALEHTQSTPSADNTRIAFIAAPPCLLAEHGRPSLRDFQTLQSNSTDRLSRGCPPDWRVELSRSFGSCPICRLFRQAWNTSPCGRLLSASEYSLCWR